MPCLAIRSSYASSTADIFVVLVHEWNWFDNKASHPKRKQLIITANTPEHTHPVILKHHTRITHKDKSTHAQAQCVSYMRFDRPHNKYC